MNSKEYISSGILELYAAGMLNESEMADVERMMRNNPEVKSELEYIQKALLVSLSTRFKSPSPKVKIDILNKINKSKDYDDKPFLKREASVYKAKNKYSYLLAASVAFLILSLGANYFLLNKLKDANREIAVLNDQRKIMVQDFEAVNRKLDKTSHDMQIVSDRNYKLIDLRGLEKSPSSSVLAFWNPGTRKVYVEVLNLPVPPANKQYQLWALSNGKPIDAGVMDVDPADKTLHEMKNIDDAQAFAITLEPKGGSINPTLDEMYAMGKL